MRISGTSARKAGAFAAAVAFLAAAASPRTLAVLSGRATASGRPLMWKNRATSDPNNKLLFFKGRKHDFVAVVISEDTKGDEV